MHAWRWLSLGLAGLAMASPASSRAGGSWEAWFSAELRRVEMALAALEIELQQLPPPPLDQTAGRLGWHARFGGTAQGKSAVVDLGRDQGFDAVVLIPAKAPSGRQEVEGYGFPPRFRVEVLSDEQGALPMTLLDHTQADFPPPGVLPVVIETPGARGRWVRVTATGFYHVEAGRAFALAEIMVLAGELNVAASAPVLTDDDYLNAPAWQPANLTDGQSPLGAPLAPEPAPRFGYHAALAERAEVVKWCQLDLGEVYALDEVRLHSARPDDFPPRRGFGFPLRFRVEAARTADFSDATCLLEVCEEDFLNPGENPVVIPARGTEARWVRVTATKLWQRDEAHYAFALAEMEVWSGGRNVALTATAEALDSEEVSRWTLPALNDGFTSQGRLMPQSEWLRGLSRRRERIAQRPALRAAHAEAQRVARWRAAAAAGGAVTIGMAGLSWVTVRRRQRYERELSQLRRRIAADLHDEVGSNLGTIALLSQLAASQKGGSARQDLLEIQRLAQESTEAMRDLVWLIQPGCRTPGDLLARMRETAVTHLAGLDWTWEAEGVQGPFHLEAERQIFLFFKEALHNVRKHAQARRVEITLRQTGREFYLAVRDDGVGFNASEVTAGHGLASLRHRAESLGGRFVLESQPGRGALVGLYAPLL